LPLVLRPGLAFPACTGLKQEVPYGTPLLPSQPSASLLAEIDNWLISADSLTYCLLKLMSQLSLHQNLKEQLSSSATLNSGFKPAASSDTRSVSATHGFRALPVTAWPSGFPFPCRGVVPGRSVFQALVPLSRRIRHQFQITRDRSPSYSEAL
jgi:hypothetical protein